MNLIKQHRNLLYSCLFACFALCACSESPDIFPTRPTTDSTSVQPTEPEEPTNPTTPQTILIYMAADNSLSSDAFDNLDSISSYVKENGLENNHILVYLDAYGWHSNGYDYDGRPQLFSFEPSPTDTNSVANSAGHYILKQYEEQNSMDSQTIKSVISDVERIYPNDSLGLILWSHASAWFPSVYTKVRSFGSDEGRQIDINELANTLGDHTFNYILFDACGMGSIECVYELRKNTDYIIASPGEIMAVGFPYKSMLPYLLQDEPDLYAVSQAFYDFYKSYDVDGLGHHSGYIALYKTSEVEAVAAISKEIFQGKGLNTFADQSFDKVQILTHLQQFPSPLYDMKSLLGLIATTDQMNRLEEALAKMIPAKFATEEIYSSVDLFIPLTQYSGLSMYAPQEEYPSLNDWYKTLTWYKDTFE